jgi:hypothetical protein
LQSLGNNPKTLSSQKNDFPPINLVALFKQLKAESQLQIYACEKSCLRKILKQDIFVIQHSMTRYTKIYRVMLTH